MGLKSYSFIVFFLVPTIAFADDGRDSGNWLNGILLLLAIALLFSALMNITNWIEAKADLAQEEARRRKLENDHMELTLKRASKEDNSERHIHPQKSTESAHID